MKIYLAGRYSRRDQLKVVRQKLLDMGHEVTSGWLDTIWERRPGESSCAPPEYRAKHAVIDMEDVRAADLVISYTEEPESTNGKKGGRHVEFGLAVAWGKRTIVVGYRENVFHHLPCVEFFATEDEMLQQLMRERA